MSCGHPYMLYCYLIIYLLLNYLAFQSFNYEHTWWSLFQKRTLFYIYIFITVSWSISTFFLLSAGRYLRFYYCQLVDISANGLLVLQGIICPAVGASARTFFYYIYWFDLIRSDNNDNKVYIHNICTIRIVEILENCVT